MPNLPRHPAWTLVKGAYSVYMAMAIAIVGAPRLVCVASFASPGS